MKQMLLRLLFIAVLTTNTAVAGTLSDAEIARLRSEITSMLTAFEQGSAEEIIERTHESLFALVGGREAFAKITRDAVEQLRESDVKFVSSELGTPTQTIPAGSEEVCFVPRVSVMEISGKRLKSTTFMIAIRRVGDGNWKYLDGAGLRKHPDFLSRLLPDLAPDVEYPENKMEML